MKFWILALSLFILGCGSGESGSSADAAKDDAPSAGQDIADTLNDAQQRAKDVEATLEEKKNALDEELDEADD